MSKHTKGTLKLDQYRHVDDCRGESFLLNGVSLPTGNHPRADEATENTRRLVACWNSCAGIPTERLEAIAAKGQRLNPNAVLFGDVT